jgi:hypothetical protein
MHIGRDRGLGQPENRAELRARGVDGDPIGGSHQGQRHARRVNMHAASNRPDTRLHPIEQSSASSFPCTVGAVHTCPGFVEG